MITPVAPAALASALAGSDLGRDALKFLTVMAFVDGSLDQAKIASVLRYASALGIAERYLDEIREAAHGRLQEVLADMTRCNMESITGRHWADGDVIKWLLPYGGADADPALAQRFEALAQLAPDTFGHCFWVEVPLGALREHGRSRQRGSTRRDRRAGGLRGAEPE
jgi:hypothetical protein